MMQTYFLVIMIILFRVIKLPLCITVTCVVYRVHALRVGILVIYSLLHTYLLSNLHQFHIISMGINPIVTYCLHVFTFKGGYSCYFYTFRPV